MSPPVASHTITPLLDDAAFFDLLDRHFIPICFQHVLLSALLEQLSLPFLRHNLARFLSQILGGLPSPGFGVKLELAQFDALVDCLALSLNASGIVGKPYFTPEETAYFVKSARELRWEFVTFGKSFSRSFSSTLMLKSHSSDFPISGGALYAEEVDEEGDDIQDYDEVVSSSTVDVTLIEETFHPFCLKSQNLRRRRRKWRKSRQCCIF